MKYKVGDVVRIVKERTKGMNPRGYVDRYLGTVMTIARVTDSYYYMLEDYGTWHWNDDMIDSLVKGEMTAVELLEWFREHYRSYYSMSYAFGENLGFDRLLMKFSSEEIVFNIRRFEANHAPKKMTVAEIEEQLGYRVEIIAEDKKKEE